MLDRTRSIYHPIQLHDWGKSRLGDTFGESCPTINFILGKDEGYPPGDSAILAFMCEKLPKELPRSPMRFPNHHQGGLLLIREGQPQYGISLAAGLLEASFEICELKLSAFLALGIYIGTEYNLA